MPPTTARLRYSSVAMRRVIFWSNAFMCVSNGRARAPPWTSCRMGVSTSTYVWRNRVSRAERLGRHGPGLGHDGQFPAAGGDDFALDEDMVAQVNQGLPVGEGLFAHV